MMTIGEAIEACPLIAILRGLEPSEALPVADVLVEAGFKIIEVPLNSPQPLESIEKIAVKHSKNAVVGAGTVLQARDVQVVGEAGGRVIVAPNMSLDVGHAAVERGLAWCPGVFTPTEAFSALDLGASVLKFFPAEMLPPRAIGAMRAVLPRDAVVAAVGGITPDSMGAYLAAGTDAFGLGSALFKPGYQVEDVGRRARRFVTTLRTLRKAM
ncbi:MAG: 2-dehydro-3-deoxy-6-phosphogalactonate aldolase [Paracoccaceae bacterium]|nr:2-dehydro-3-deoxy-6-phosphogalactonate aldolase [Paracoccaceae bacterium]